MKRTILHSDLNSFYASVECLYDPKIRDKPVSVCGNAERHGIVLASNPMAKKYGIKTAEGTWEAIRKCPDLIVVPPRMDRYVRFSKFAREIYGDYSPCVEPFGLDECWIDLTGTGHLFGSGETVANEIRRRIRKELGITVSIGVSYNKVFSKLASDMKKPDAVTVVPEEDWKSRVWPLPVSELLYVGRSTTEKLARYGIRTIGQLAETDCDILKSWFGVNGPSLWRSANGMDHSQVSATGTPSVMKSIGNSTTTPRDLLTLDDMSITVFKLAESVAERLREAKFKCRTIQVWIRGNNLIGFERQAPLSFPSCTAKRIGEKSMELILSNWKEGQPVRALGIRACKLLPDEFPQYSLFRESIDDLVQEDLERAIQSIRDRFGHFSIQRGLMFTDTHLSHLDVRSETSHQSIAFIHG